MTLTAVRVNCFSWIISRTALCCMYRCTGVYDINACTNSTSNVNQDYPRSNFRALFRDSVNFRIVNSGEQWLLFYSDESLKRAIIQEVDITLVSVIDVDLLLCANDVKSFVCKWANVSPTNQRCDQEKTDFRIYFKNDELNVSGINLFLQFIRYTQHVYTYGMRRNKHNIHTYYRTRLFWLQNDNVKEKI